MMLQGQIVRKTLLLAGVAAIAGLLTACSSEVTRFGGTNNPLGNPFQTRSSADPLLTNSINRPRQQATYQPQPFPPISNNGAYTQSLPPYNAPLTTGSIPKSTQTRGAIPARIVSPGAVANANYPSLTPAAATRGPQVVGANQGWTAVGGTPVTLQQGETINTLSQRYGVPASAIMAVNGFSNVQQAQPGQQVMIPAYNANMVKSPEFRQIPQVSAAPLQPMPAPIQPKPASIREIMPQPMSSAERQAAQKISEAKAQEQMQAQAQRANITARLAEARRQEDANKLTESQKKIELKNAEAQRLAQLQKSKPIEREEITGSVPNKTGIKPASQPQLNEKMVETTRAEEYSDNASSFRWPARGKVISSFGSRGTGGANDGINIAMPEGTPVRAAEGGTVVHADDALKGYGKLVLIRHPSGHVTVYAHNSELNVKRGESVKRGQMIAKSGQTGNVTAPQLHFEIRKGATPVDPTKYLASN